MELGATVCTPQSPICMLCPWNKNCVARQKDLISKLPLKQPKAAFEIWIWNVQLVKKNDKYAMVLDHGAPFLKKDWMFPGTFKKLTAKPKKFHVKHGITKYDIFIQIEDKPVDKKLTGRDVKWVNKSDIPRLNPSSMLRKILQSLEK